jgi:uncharacterized membrane protein YidH (DUF202 family)
MKTFLAWFALSLTCGAGGIAQDRLPTELRTLFDYDTKVLHPYRVIEGDYAH